MKGTTCPICQNEVMRYGQFFREAEPYKTYKCSNCGTELKRNPIVWLLLASMAVPAFIFAFFMIPRMAGWPLVYAILSGILFVLALTLLVNFIGWKYVGWQPVSRET